MFANNFFAFRKCRLTLNESPEKSQGNARQFPSGKNEFN